MQSEKKYYNPCRLALSGREYKVLRSYKDGRKKIQFDDFFGEIVIADPDDLDGRYKNICEKMWKEEKDRIARDNGWI